MNSTTELALKSIAPQLLQGILPNPSPVVAQRAIAILKVLEDGQWHTATNIGSKLNIGSKYVRDICRVCSDAWGLESHKRSGWRMPDDADGDCIACGGTGYDREKGDPEIPCPSCGGRGIHLEAACDV